MISKSRNPSLLQPWPRACLPTSNNHVDNYAWIQKLCIREADTVEQTTLMTKPAMGTMILLRRGSVNPNSDERQSLTIPTKQRPSRTPKRRDPETSRHRKERCDAARNRPRLLRYCTSAPRVAARNNLRDAATPPSIPTAKTQHIKKALGTSSPGSERKLSIARDSGSHESLLHH